MKPKAQNEHDDGLLEYLEDIIGTAKYKQPIEDAAKEVETLNEVCLEKSNRVTIVEKEKDNLEVHPFQEIVNDRVKNRQHWRTSRMKMSWLGNNLLCINYSLRNVEITLISPVKSSYGLFCTSLI